MVPGEAFRIVLADDHPIVLSGLKALIQTDRMFRVVAACPDGRSALNAIREALPDLAVLDIAMPELTGLDVLAALREAGIASQVVFLTASAHDAQIVEAVARGVRGLMLKSSAPDQLLNCLRTVSSGETWLPRDLVEAALQREEKRRLDFADFDSVLTSREKEIVKLVSDGQSNKELARKIGVTEGTVKIHLHKVYQKLGVSNRTALTALALTYRDRLKM